MHEERDDDLTYRGRITLALALIAGAVLVLLLASCARCAPSAHIRVDPVVENEYARTVLIDVTVMVPNPSSPFGMTLAGCYGSGVRVGGTTVLTAAHVINCVNDKASPFVVAVVDADGARHFADVGAVSPMDIARLDVSDLAPMSPVTIAKAQRGERACGTFANPEIGRRCGEVWSSYPMPPGDIHVDAVAEHGNSGGPLWDADGDLLGIIVNLHWCRGTENNKQVCTMGATSLWDRSWLAQN